MSWKKRAHSESVIPGDFKRPAYGKCDFITPCFEKVGDSLLFLALLPPHHPPTLLLAPPSLLPSSPSPLHLGPSLYYAEENSPHL